MVLNCVKTPGTIMTASLPRCTAVLQMPLTPPSSNQNSPIHIESTLLNALGANADSTAHDTSPSTLKSEPDSSQILLAEAPDATAASEPEDVISISTTFHTDAGLLPFPPDVILLSSDGVLFYVHRTQILTKSINGFHSRLPRDNLPDVLRSRKPPIVPCSNPAVVLNVVAHVIYDMSCEHYCPTLDTLASAVDAMAMYGISPQLYITPSTPLYALILNQAPMNPLLAYTLAAKHDIYALAVPVSTYLLSYPLKKLPEDATQKIGPLYLKRLYFLHLGRLQTFRTLLVDPPHLHPETDKCDFSDQKRLARAWALATAYLAWEARPDTTASAIEGALCPLADYLTCELCKKSLVDRVKQVIVQWSMVKRTI
ncbi:hypothetical protein C8Q76DRAFT_669740 [Earliella scabrosa]|nr:hypothetical protein C8Q76DRAFT_669740 [Earliella scabrosa]